eukprot:4543845-Alexandrium_andersonii.AAC.1
MGLAPGWLTHLRLILPVLWQVWQLTQWSAQKLQLPWPRKLDRDLLAGLAPATVHSYQFAARAFLTHCRRRDLPLGMASD